MEMRGRSIIGYGQGQGTEPAARAINPTTGETMGPDYVAAQPEEIEEAVRLADRAFAPYSALTGRQRGHFLRTIASRIESLGSVLTERAVAESGLPTARIQTETGRTCNQLRMFAIVAEEGSWVDARIDRADPARQPLPKPDIRSMLRPLGPVVVFGASNFPLAFSVAGGDTASALAAGCPVVVKAHNAHPGTSELVGLAVQDAARECGMPEGVFSLLYGAGNELGLQLVNHPLIKAGGFTGSRTGGKALYAAAISRPEPIPFYAEMSSVNPLFILPGAMSERGDALATGVHASVTLGSGQFCTKPGLILIADDQPGEAFITRLAELMSGTATQTMLTPGIGNAYRAGLSAHRGHTGVTTLAAVSGSEADDDGSCRAGTALFRTDAATLLANPVLADEVFGPATLVVTCRDVAQMIEIARQLEGQLTATIHATDEDLHHSAGLVAAAESRAGRLVFNGFPTGVEVCHSMVHGGPWPATSDSRSTSVGTRAISRFARLVCYQASPEAALPSDLHNANPNGIWRLVDGRFTQDAL